METRVAAAQTATSSLISATQRCLLGQLVRRNKGMDAVSRGTEPNRSRAAAQDTAAPMDLAIMAIVVRARAGFSVRK